MREWASKESRWCLAVWWFGWRSWRPHGWTFAHWYIWIDLGPVVLRFVRARYPAKRIEFGNQREAGGAL